MAVARFQVVSVVRVEVADGDDLIDRFKTWSRGCSLWSPQDDACEPGRYVGYHSTGDALRIRDWLGDQGVTPSEHAPVDALVRLATELVLSLEPAALPRRAQRAERRLRAFLGGRPCPRCGAPTAGIPCDAADCPWR
jgi:hypothetical protein